MPHDARGEELKVGDIVMVPCRVKAIHLTEEYCNVDLETKLTMPPLDHVQTFTLNSRQTIKPTATHRYYEYGAEVGAGDPAGRSTRTKTDDDEKSDARVEPGAAIRPPGSTAKTSTS